MRRFEREREVRPGAEPGRAALRDGRLAGLAGVLEYASDLFDAQASRRWRSG